MNYRMNIEDRLANRREQAWARSLMVTQTSTLAGRAPASVPGEQPIRSKKPVALVLVLIALVSLWATALGAGN
jgi:hypothetical protein